MNNQTIKMEIERHARNACKAVSARSLKPLDHSAWEAKLTELMNEALSLKPDDEFGWQMMLNRIDRHPINPEVPISNWEIAMVFGLLGQEGGVLNELWNMESGGQRWWLHTEGA